MAEEPRFAELDARDSDAGNVRVQLLWDRLFQRTVIKLEDDKAEVFEVFEVPSSRALDAFRHPYSYLYADDTQQVAGAGSW